MNSLEFERAAKAALGHVLAVDRGMHVPAEEMQLVWFAHVLGSKKAMIFCPALAGEYAEITFNAGTGEIYVDIYAKMSNAAFSASQAAALGKEGEDEK